MITITITITITGVRVQRCNTFIPTLGSEGPQWDPVELICLSISLFGHPRFLLVIICMACNCAQRMRPQATDSN